MAEYADNTAGLQKAAQFIAKELSNSYKGQDLSTLTPSIQPGQVGGFGAGTTPIRTDVFRKGIDITDLGAPKTEYENSQLVEQYMNNPTAANQDAMVANRKYLPGAFWIATQARPYLHTAYTNFINWEEQISSLNVNSDKMQRVHKSLLNDSNKHWWKALTAPMIRLVSKDRTSNGLDATYKTVELPESRIWHISGKETLSYRDLLTVRAKIQNSDCTNLYMMFNWYQQVFFKDLNKEYLQNRDFVSSADLTQLDKSLAFQGMMPVIIEDALENGKKNFGTHESKIVFTNPNSLVKVNWASEDVFKDAPLANTAARMYARTERYDYVRTDDDAVFVVIFDDLVPSLAVGTSTFSSVAATGATGLESTVTVNDNTIEKQPWYAVSSVDWITLTNASGLGSGTLKFSVDANPSTSATRSGTITVVSYDADLEEITKTISVTQLANSE